jgi:tetratricopeptide (TPR) repeat protein
MLLLCLARPELLDERPGWPGEPIELEPLAPGDAEAIVTALAPGLASDTRARATHAAQGNPLFLEQLLNLATEEDGGDLLVPPTIQALLAARLDRLQPEERAVIEPAAAIGKEFWRGAVVELAPQVDEVSAVLQRLVRKELVRPGRSTLLGEDEFRFHHVLIRDVAYSGISKEARARFHGGFADWLERNAPEYEEIIGYHLEQAYRCRTELGPAGKGEQDLAARAAERLGSAGRRASRRGDMGAAANLLERTLELLPAEDPERFELATELASSLEQAGRLAEAEGLLRESADNATRLGYERHAAHARTELAHLHFMHRPDASIEELRAVAAEVRRVFEKHQDDRGLARVGLLRGAEDWSLVRYGAAAEDFGRALAHAHRAGDDVLERVARNWLTASCYWGPVPVPEAVDRVAEILEETADESFEHANALTFLGGLEAMRGDFERARGLYRSGMAALESLNAA